MEFQKYANPCRNFNVLSIIPITDPRDSQTKVVFVTITQCGTGMLVLADYTKGKYEAYELLADGGAWALLQLEDGSILVGTCNKYGSVQRLDLVKGTWYPLLRTESEEYVWDFALGGDGNVYGGTWSGDKLLQYNPANHTLTDLGKVSEDEKNNYSRHVYTTPQGNILISSGFARKEITLYKTAEQCLVQNFTNRDCNVFYVGHNYLCTTDGETLEFANPDTGEKLEAECILEKDLQTYTGSCPLVKQVKEDAAKSARYYITSKFGETFGASCTYLPDGTIIGVQGQELFTLTPGEDICHYSPIEVTPPVTFIHELITDEKGIIWGASSFGMTIFSFNPATGEYNNTKAITQCGGEVYGMAARDGKIYCTAYTGGEHVVYDPALPWDARGNNNPKMVRSLYKQYIRPYTKSKMDSDGYIWTGWLTDYGIRGFCISKWNTADNTIELFEDIVPKTSIFGLDIGGDYVWFTTNNHANGLPDADGPLSLCAIDKDGNLVFKRNFAKGLRVGRIAFAGRYGVVQVGRHLYRIDSLMLAVEKLDTVSLLNYRETEIHAMLAVDDTTVAVFDLEETFFVCTETGEVTQRVKTPIGNPKDLFYHSVFAATMVNGDLYASVGGDLYKLTK